MIHDFLHYDFLRYALIGTIFLSISSGILSPLVVAKKHAFMGSALSHSTLLGVAIALSIVEATPNFDHGQENILIFAITFIITLILVLILAQLTFNQKQTHDSIIGIFLALTMGMAVLVHQFFVQGSNDLMGYLFGQIILLGEEDIILAAMTTFILGVVVIYNLPKWRAIIFDEEGARLIGIKVKFYHSLFYLLLTLFIVSGVKISGTILINSLILAPGLFAFQYAKSLQQSIIIAVIFSVSTSIIGLVLASILDLPTGASMASIQCLILLFSYAIKIKRI